jgi:hypothetical protein
MMVEEHDRREIAAAGAPALSHAASSFGGAE